MKKILFCFLLVLFFVCGCTKETERNELSLDEKIEKQISEMTLEEKIGQMLIVCYRSSTASDELIRILNDVKPGGFILFSENFESYTQVKKFIYDVNNTSDVPLFWAIDQEGGRVQRLKTLSDKEVTIFPTMAELGITNDIELAHEVGRVMGEELGVFGINMNFAPVLDIYSNPDNTVIGDRAFGTNDHIVTTMALSFSSGLESTGVIPVYKHFPGHGDTSEDSHDTLPVINKTKEELLQSELKPFIAAIDNGAKVIMVGHLAVPNITGSTVPASLSKEIITDLLKEELGFHGLVITDALNMGALTNHYSKEEIYIQAINAGVDLLLMASPASEAVQIVKTAVFNGEIDEERLNESVKKILTLKYTTMIEENRYDESYLGSSEHQEIINQISNYK